MLGGGAVITGIGVVLALITTKMAKRDEWVEGALLTGGFLALGVKCILAGLFMDRDFKALHETYDSIKNSIDRAIEQVSEV